MTQRINDQIPFGCKQLTRPEPRRVGLSPLSSYTFPLSTPNSMCFQRHSRFAVDFSTAVLCFQQHSCVDRSIFEVTTPAHGQSPQTKCRFRRPADVRHPGVIVLGTGSSPHIAGWEFIPQSRQYPRFAGNSRVKRAWRRIPVQTSPTGGRQASQSETAPVLTLIGYDTAGMLSRDNMSTCVAQGGSRHFRGTLRIDGAGFGC